MTSGFFAFLLTLINFVSLSSAQYCQYNGCSFNYQCDRNTGYCRPFRLADSGTNVGCGACPSGTACDQNTGRCLPFRNPVDVGGGASPNCARVFCPSGYYCEPSTGICNRGYNPYRNNRLYDPYNRANELYDPYSSFNYPTTSNNNCNGVICPSGQQCDENTGICRSFRGKRQADLCTGVECLDGMSCDSNTGSCVTFRNTGGVHIIHADDRCATVGCPTGMSCEPTTGNCLADSLQGPCSRLTCPQGTVCDTNTGKCQQFRLPAASDLSPTNSNDFCARVDCPSGYFCEQATGICQPSGNSRQSDDPCSRLTCPQGTSCDSNTGMCRQFRPAADMPAVENNLCDRVECPSGYFCQSGTGFCQPAIQREDPCNRITCPQGTSCDTNTGMCRQFRPATDFVPGNDGNICSMMYCPTGTSCNPSTESCQSTFRDPTIPECPVNSHWEPCASPCPYSCTHKGERCQLRCISTCVCNEGYVEASRTDLTCIPQQQCEAYNADRCIAPQCQANEECVDDLCNSSLCPQIERDSLRPGCQYILTRNINQCLMFDQKCDQIL